MVDCAKNIKAITFDLWDTIIDDDSDEPNRKAKGLLSKLETRHFIVWHAIQDVSPLSLESVAAGYQIVDDDFNQHWHKKHVTWTVTERMQRVFKQLNVDLPEAKFREVVLELEEMELEVPPVAIDGVHQALAILSRDFALAVVSDTINTPGTGLRKWLQRNDLLKYFSAFAFSDEVGRSKPHRAMFESALQGLECEVDEAVHIGDREHNDIQGAHALGMRAILFTASRDVDAANTTADAICDDYSRLPDVVNSLA